MLQFGPFVSEMQVVALQYLTFHNIHSKDEEELGGLICFILWTGLWVIFLQHKSINSTVNISKKLTLPVNN